MNFDENRSWMYNRFFEQTLGLRKEFVEGVERFTLKAKLLPEYMREGKIKCPCVKCKCSHIQHIDTVKLHLYKKGFMPNYFVWTAHGERYPSVDEVNNQNEYAGVSGAYVGNNYPTHDMINDACGMYHGEPSQPTVEELPNEEAQFFYDQLKEASQPFYEGCSHSKLSVAVRLLSIKSDYNISQGGMDEIIGLMNELNLSNLALPTSYYDSKKLVEPRAQQVDEKYKSLYEGWVESQGSVDEGGDPKPTPEEEEAMFIEAAGGYTSKNRAYGLGPSRYKEPSRIGIVNSYTSSSIDNDNVDPAVQVQLDEMKERIIQQENERKEMERKLADQAEKLAKFEAWFSTYGPGSDSQRRE